MGADASPAPDVPLTDLGVAEIAARIRDGSLSSVAVVEACLERIEATDPELRAWAVVAERALADAAERDRERVAGGPAGPLHGVPIGIKDIVDVAGLPTTCGAPAFAHREPAVDATLVARLRAAGAVILGKTVPTAFAYKDPAPTRNPWSAARTPGGSSSGSAAAVGARQVPAAIGTQTVGSILRPAAFCGVVGLKGGYGDVPLDGVVPLAWSFDHAGPIARSVADAALIESVIADRPLDDVGFDRPRLGVSVGLLDRAEPAMRSRLDELLADLRSRVGLADVALPIGIEAFVDAGNLVLEAEAATFHRSMFERHGADYPPSIGALVRRGLERPATEVVEAQRTVAAYRDALVPAIAGVDALVTPVSPGPAPDRAGGTGDPWLCAPWSFAGFPAITIPIGLDGSGLPLGVQLVAAPGGLPRLLRTAAWLEAIVGRLPAPGVGRVAV